MPNSTACLANRSLLGGPPGNFWQALRTIAAVRVAPINSNALIVAAAPSPAELKKYWSKPPLLTSASKSSISFLTVAGDTISSALRRRTVMMPTGITRHAVATLATIRRESRQRLPCYADRQTRPRHESSAARVFELTEPIIPNIAAFAIYPRKPDRVGCAARRSRQAACAADGARKPAVIDCRTLFSAGTWVSRVAGTWVALDTVRVAPRPRAGLPEPV